MMIDGDVIVRLTNLPSDVKGFVAPSPDGVYNVYLNARQSAETQLGTFFHELAHIEREDFESGLPLEKVEGE